MGEKADAQIQQLGQQPIPGLILKLAAPTVAAMVVTAVYNMGDAFFAARLGTGAAGGVGVVFSFMALIQAVGFTVALGGSTWISRLLGEKKQEESQKVAASTLWLGVSVGLLLGAAGFIFARPITDFMGATKTILPYAVAYAKPVAAAAPFTAGCFALSCLLRAQGRATLAMWGVVVGGLLNVVLDPLLMFTFSLGISGAGLATLLGQAVSFLVLLLPFLRGRSALSCAPRYAARQAGVYGYILKNGMSSFFRQGMASMATIALNRTAACYGDQAVAAMTIAGKIAGLLYSAFLGFGQGYQPVAGYCYGAGDTKRLHKAFLFTLFAGTMGLTVLSAACFVLAVPLVNWFGAGQQQVAEMGALALKAQALAMPLVPLAVLTNMTYQSINRPVMATLLACCRQGFCFLPLIWLLPKMWNFAGVAAAQAGADGITFVLSLLPLWQLFWGKSDRHFQSEKKR